MSTQLDNNPSITVREATLDDAERCGHIFFTAFESIANEHNFPVEPGSIEFSNYKIGELLETAGIFGLVAESAGDIVGSAFVDERSAIAGVGPVTVAPGTQMRGVGRTLMEHLIAREQTRDATGVRLVQTAYNSRSFALYSKLGFSVREPLSVLQGSVLQKEILPAVDALQVRPTATGDIDECNLLCRSIHGYDREAELRAGIAAGTASLVHDERHIVGFATGFGYGWFAVAIDNDGMIALLASAPAFMGLGVLVPSRNDVLLEWCLQHGLRLIQQATLMTTGLWSEPNGAWLPSIVY